MRIAPPSPGPDFARAAEGPRGVAIVHDWLDTWRGGESVLAEICRIWPQADLYALVDFLDPVDRAKLDDRRAATSFVQRMPLARRNFRYLLPLFPRAIESLDLARYDLVVSSSHAVAKGVRTHPRQLHVSYCYTPMRYAWDLQEDYLAQVKMNRGLRGMLVRRMLARLRAWDRTSSARVDAFVAISRFIAERIRRAYDRTSTVIYPPVAVAPAARRDGGAGPYVTVSQLVPYKRIDLVVAAFRAVPERELIVIGEGPERARIAALAGPNVQLLGRVSDAARDRLVASARAFVFAAEEDFGIAPLEAQGMGVPVIALGRGGTAETICGLDAAQPTGVLYAEQSATAIAAAIRTFEAQEDRISPAACRRNAERFAPARFRRELAQFVAQRWAQFAAREH